MEPVEPEKSLLSRLWEKVKHPLQQEAVVFITLLATAAAAGLNYLSDHASALAAGRGMWAPFVIYLIGAFVARGRVWSAKAVEWLRRKAGVAGAT